MKAEVTRMQGDKKQGAGKTNLPASSRKINYSLWLLACSFWLLGLNSLAQPVFAQKGNANNGVNSCSEQNLEILTTQLMRDLPNYANRATQRARRLSRSTDLFSYMLVAGKPEFTPLPLNSEENIADAPKSAGSGVEQVFFTTLVRQYIDKTAVESQEFHWLLLTKTKNGWRVVMMFTQTGSAPGQPSSPPRDSSNGAIAQGVKAWLRDCQAGSVRIRAAN